MYEAPASAATSTQPAIPNEEGDEKATVDNIIAASNIDINKLLADGMERFTQLDQFQQAFSETNFNEIATLKSV